MEGNPFPSMPIIDLSPARVRDTYQAIRHKDAGVSDEALCEAAWEALFQIPMDEWCRAVVYRARQLEATR
jgi:hypothetical protein